MEAIDVTPVEVSKSGESSTGQAAAPKSKIGKIIIGFIIVAVIVVIIFIATGNKTSAAPMPNAATGGGANLQPTGTSTGSNLAPKTTKTTTTNTVAPKTTTPLVGCQQNWSYKEGNGGYIQDLQKFLNSTNSAGLVADGYYGTKTDAAVVAWTRKTNKTAADVACATWEWKKPSGGSTQVASTGIGGKISDAELKTLNLNLNTSGFAYNESVKAKIVAAINGKDKNDLKTRYKASYGKELFAHMTESLPFKSSKFSTTEATMLLG